VFSSKKRRLFYHCYDHQRPTGGQKSTYQHVDVLNSSGYEAFAVHSDSAFRLRWFPNDTRTISWSEMWRLYDIHTDILVLPEDVGNRIAEYPGKKVIFNKNLYHGYRALGPLTSVGVYDSPDLVGVMTVSDHNRRQLQFAFPDLLILKVVEHIDSSRFTLTTLDEKKRQLAYINKGGSLLLTTLHTLQARAFSKRNVARDLAWVAIENKTEQEVARVLRESLIFLFLSVEEGLGRMPLEALLSGCVLLTWDAGPIDEYVPDIFRFPYGDVVSLVSALEKMIEPSADLSSLQMEVLAGRDNALRYSAEEQKQSVCVAWEALLQRANST